MAQEVIFENDTQGTVKYSTLSVGSFLLFQNVPYIKAAVSDRAVSLQDGSVLAIGSSEDVISPTDIIIKFE